MTLAKDVAVAPRRKLGTPGVSDANEVGPVGGPCESNLIGGHTLPTLAKEAFTGFDRLPALLQRGEVPSAA